MITMWYVTVITERARAQYNFKTKKDAHNIATAFIRQLGERGVVEIHKVGWI